MSQSTQHYDESDSSTLGDSSSTHTKINPDLEAGSTLAQHDLIENLKPGRPSHQQQPTRSTTPRIWVRTLTQHTGEFVSKLGSSVSSALYQFARATGTSSSSYRYCCGIWWILAAYSCFMSFAGVAIALIPPSHNTHAHVHVTAGFILIGIGLFGFAVSMWGMVARRTVA